VPRWIKCCSLCDFYINRIWYLLENVFWETELTGFHRHWVNHLSAISFICMYIRAYIACCCKTNKKSDLIASFVLFEKKSPILRNNTSKILILNIPRLKNLNRKSIMYTQYNNSIDPFREGKQECRGSTVDFSKAYGQYRRSALGYRSKKRSLGDWSGAKG
jgi:hypothetical protein